MPHASTPTGNHPLGSRTGAPRQPTKPLSKNNLTGEISGTA